MDQVDDALHEWHCPSCGAVTRARMADSSESQGVLMIRKKLQKLAEEWEAQMPLQVANEMAAAAAAILRECSASVRSLIADMEGGHDSAPHDRR